MGILLELIFDWHQIAGYLERLLFLTFGGGKFINEGKVIGTLFDPIGDLAI
jgi:hypothetical protein